MSSDLWADVGGADTTCHSTFNLRTYGNSEGTGWKSYAYELDCYTTVINADYEISAEFRCCAPNIRLQNLEGFSPAT